MSSGGQFIAVAVSPENTGQAHNSHQSDAGATTSGTPGTNASTDEDEGPGGPSTSFEDFTTATAYANGNSTPAAM